MKTTQEWIETWTKEIKLDPNDGMAYCWRADAYLKLGDNDKAIADYTQAIKIDPTEACAYANRGYIYADLGDYENAIKDASKECELGDCELYDELYREKLIDEQSKA